MNYEKYKQTIEKMSQEEKETASLMYLKDIKDLLMSMCEHLKIELKHY